MKNLLKILAVAVFALSACVMNAQNRKEKKAREAEVTFAVSIDCEGCKAKLEANLPFVKGVKDLKVDLDTRTVWFRYQPSRTDVATLEKEIEKLGYEAEELKETEK